MPDFSKYSNEKRSEKISLIVFHCFALPTKQMLSVFKNTGTGIHYIIQRNGTILNLIDENMVAYHAGLSSWREFKTGINAKSIGIELQNSFMGNKAYTKAQIKSLISLTKEIIKRHDISAKNIVGHSDIAPFRKPDPSIFFPWSELAENGIGIWPDLSSNSTHNGLISKNEIRELLEKIGYNTVDLTAAMYAFATRFFPQKITVQNDIIERENKVFTYWQKIKPSEEMLYLKKAPKIYPSSAEKLLQDTELFARLKIVAQAYERKD